MWTRFFARVGVGARGEHSHTQNCLSFEFADIIMVRRRFKNDNTYFFDVKISHMMIHTIKADTSTSTNTLTSIFKFNSSSFQGGKTKKRHLKKFPMIPIRTE